VEEEAEDLREEEEDHEVKEAQPINEEDLDVVDEAVEEEAEDLREEEEDHEVEEDQREAEKMRKEELGFQSPNWEDS
jgi:hypothetical protein